MSRSFFRTHAPSKAQACLDRPMVRHRHALDPLIGISRRTVASAAAAKDVLVGWRSGHDGLWVQDDPGEVIDALSTLLFEAIRRSPVRGVVTIEVSVPDGRIEVAVFDQRPDAGPDLSGPSGLLTLTAG